ncbi:MAG TPA: response regulator [Terracidiphilus sp.]
MIDDSSTFREYLRSGLQDAGYDVLTAETGEQGLALAQSSEIGAFIVDNVLPGIDGASVVRRLRQQVRHRRTPSLLLTSSTDPRHELNALEAGADAFVLKEESMEVLLARLASALRSVGASIYDSVPQGDRRPPSVLFVDALKDWSEPVAAALRQEGVDVRAGKSEGIASHPSDCIVLSVSSVASASDLIAKLRKRDVPRSPRIVLVGESQSRTELVDAIALGADDYLPSSAGEAVMTARLHAQLRRKQLEDENEIARENLIRHRMELENQTQLAAARAAIAEELRAARDIAERKAREAENLLAQNDAVFRSMADGLVIVDLNGGIIQANQAAMNIFGVSEPAHLERMLDPNSAAAELRTLAGEIVPPSEWPLSQACRGVSISNLELQVVRRQGNSQFLATFNAVPVRDREGTRILAALTFRDITSLKRSEEILRKTEQLAVTGRLAASIAHEINNPLSAVMNLLFLAELDARDNPHTAEMLDKAQKELRRIADITRQTLAFYRDWNRPIETDVSAMVSDIADMFTVKLRVAEMEVQLELDASAQPCVYPGELRQAISNVLSNAIEASPRGGTLRVRVRNTVNNGTPGVRITIGDCGHGIPRTFYSEMFQPFSSLRGTNGTGLGLWVTQAIIVRHGGSLRFRSRTGVPSGTVFTMFVPFVPLNARASDTMGNLFRDLGRELLSPGR